MRWTWCWGKRVLKEFCWSDDEAESLKDWWQYLKASPVTCEISSDVVADSLVILFSIIIIIPRTQDNMFISLTSSSSYNHRTFCDVFAPNISHRAWTTHALLLLFELLSASSFPSSTFSPLQPCSLPTSPYPHSLLKTSHSSSNPSSAFSPQGPCTLPPFHHPH